MVMHVWLSKMVIAALYKESKSSFTSSKLRCYDSLQALHSHIL